jgi:hypothetical protein
MLYSMAELQVKHLESEINIPFFTYCFLSSVKAYFNYDSSS